MSSVQYKATEFMADYVVM